MSSPGAVAPLGAFRAATGRRGLPPVIVCVAVEGGNVTDPSVLHSPSLRVAFALHPAVAATWDSLGERTGTHSWRFATRVLRDALAAVDARTVDAAGRAERSRAARLRAAGLDTVVEEAHGARTGPAGPTVAVRRGRSHATVTVRCGPLDLGGVTVPALGEHTRVDFADACAVLTSSRSARWPTADAGTGGEFGRLAALADASVRMLKVPAAPGLAAVVVGANTAAEVTEAAESSDAPSEAAAEVRASLEAVGRDRVVTAVDALDLAGVLDGWVPLHISDDVVAAAVASDPVELDVAGLAGYQSRFVSSYVTSPGAVCALAPGLGKTVCAAAAFAQLAQRERVWRGVVVAPTAVLAQWAAELARWAPQVAVVEDAAELERADGAACVLVSTGSAAAFAQTYTGRVDDVCVDEAAWLRNPSTARSRAAWTLRARARRGLALSGTPVTGRIDDLGALAAWACGDPHLFDARPLSAWDAGWDEPGPDGFTLAEVCGAVVFTAADGTAPDGVGAVPDVDVEVVAVPPGRADLAVSDAVWELLTSRRDHLAAARAALSAAPAATAAARTARAELAAARTRLAATMSFARVALSAPGVAQRSNLDGAHQVAGRWGRHPAGAKLHWAADRTAAEVADGAQVLLFADTDAAVAATVATLDARGVAAVALDGSTRRRARDRAVDAFVTGEVPVAVVGPAAQLGVNLAVADVVVHLDCGAGGTVSKLVQRCARAARLGATGDRVTVVVPYVAGTVDEAVAVPLAGRLTERLAGAASGLGDDVAAHVDELLAARPAAH